MLKKSASLLHPTPPTTRDSSGVARAQKQPYYPHTGKSGPSSFMSSSLFVYPGWSHEYCRVRATWDALPYRRYLLASSPEKKEGNKGLMVFRVKPAPTRFTTNRLYTPMDSIPLHSLFNVCCPWGSSCSFASQRLNLLQRIDICQVRLN